MNSNICTWDKQLPDHHAPTSNHSARKYTKKSAPGQSWSKMIFPEKMSNLTLGPTMKSIKCQQNVQFVPRDLRLTGAEALVFHDELIARWCGRMGSYAYQQPRCA